MTTLSSYYLQNPNSYFPIAKIGTNVVYVYSVGGRGELQSGNKGTNYFGISSISSVDGAGGFYSTPGMTVQAASAIDRKMDDGLPQTGRVTANYINYTLTSAGKPAWAAGGGAQGVSPGGSASPLSTSCYDNGGNSANTMAYSVAQNNGNGFNCALSFQFQAGTQ